ncbi:toll-like receptor 4 isoform X2 [Esox lucius]|uniref:Toll-like receptor 4 n=3 Tax=Esox lucius TaxID=8010 RepID=A0AAY5L112_ESOLU|nr:toll-like receptor 4 isoform X2 [Esox lucius]
MRYVCAGKNLSYIPALHPKTEYLDFSFNNLASLHQNLFPKLVDLQFLDLTRCRIQHIAGNAFNNVRNVRTLVLTGNPIEHIGNKDLNTLHELQKLVLVDTGLLSIEDLHINYLNKLQELNVGANQLLSMQIPSYLINFTDFRILDLHANNITVIRADDTAVLRQIGKNITVILNRNPIIHIDPGAFQNITLRKLDLRETFISTEVTKDCLNALSGLNVGNILIGHFGRKHKILTLDFYFLQGLCGIKFQEIYFHIVERTPTGKNNLLLCMINATKISLIDGELKDTEWVQFKQIKELYLAGSRLENIPSRQLSNQYTLQKLTITENIHPVAFFDLMINMPLLQYIDISKNQLLLRGCCHTIFKFMPKLQHLNMSLNSEIQFLYKPFQGLDSLQVLDFHHTKLKSVNFNMENLKDLMYLDMSYSRIIFTHEFIFKGLGNLRVLKIPGNYFQGDVFLHMFVDLKRLEILDISSCGIDSFLWKSFGNLKELRHLTLSGNTLTAIDFVTNPGLAALSWMDLSQNQISHIAVHVLHNLPKNLTTFDLSNNPIDCSCSQSDFIMWIMTHKNIIKNHHNVLCKTSSPESSPVFDFDLESCTYILILNILGPISVVILILTLSVLAYKFQFYLRYCCILQRGYKVSQQQECAYDAFVIYSNKDEAWVMEELVENLENGIPPIQLCLHVRDFEVGKPITSNIIDEGIMGSRKVIVVVSQHFINSAWCRFEFEVAQCWLVLEGNPNIIIIILEDVEEVKIKKVFGLHKYLKKNTYLKWKDNPISSMRFWVRLRKAVLSNTPK